MITYTIQDTRFSVLADGSPDRINLVMWLASSSAGTVVATLSTRGTPIPGNYAPANAPFDTLTEQDLIDWVIELEDQVSIQAQLDAALDALMNPTTNTGVPWQNNYPLWAVGVSYAVDDVVIFQNIGYECIQAHVSQDAWAPPATPALWTPYVPDSEGPQPWVQPTGAQDAYDIGAQVTHTGHLWTSLVAANVWEPTTGNNTLWQDNGVFP